jgi:hypothetical protein
VHGVITVDESKSEETESEEERRAKSTGYTKEVSEGGSIRLLYARVWIRNGMILFLHPDQQMIY